MSVDLEAVRLLLRNRMQTAAGIPVADLRAWENRAFEEPATPTAYLRESVTISSEQLIAHNYEQASGLARYDLLYPIADGTERIGAVARAIKDVFPPNLGLAGPPQVQVYRSTRLPGREEDGKWWVVGVLIFWRAFATVPVP